jgi:hypothetical protein
MDAFRVWVRPTDYEFLVCVDGVENAHWLIDQLGRSFVFQSAQPIYQEHTSRLCSFQVPRYSQLSFTTFTKMLAAMPQVKILHVSTAN